ncbi:MAG: protein tyrosine phosphatase [Hyphomicrobiaceae bacterium]|nr:protein tyrosine phosphatase [Hyphomicrobiaceae bacterium]
MRQKTDDPAHPGGPPRGRRSGVVHVCPLSEVPSVVERARASHLVTLLQSDIPVTTPPGITDGLHLRLEVHDISEPLFDQVAPDASHVRRLIAFAESWGGEGPMVVHCWAGISRSTAAAFTSLCLVNPEVPEAAIARALRAASPTAQPNRLIVRLADDLLGRNGRMLAAVEAMGPAVPAYAARPFSLQADPGWLGMAR